MSAEITVSRPPAVWRDRLRAYKLVVDGKVVASIKPDETQTVTIAPGQHRVWAKVDWCRSPILDIDMADGDRASFRVRPNGSVALALVYATVLRTRYLELRQA